MSLPELPPLPAIPFQAWGEHNERVNDLIAAYAVSYGLTVQAAERAKLFVRVDAHPPVQPTEPVALSVIRKWPEGFEARLQAVWVDVIGFIPTVKLYDLQRVLAEFGFRMEVYEDAAHPPVQPTEPSK